MHCRLIGGCPSTPDTYTPDIYRHGTSLSDVYIPDLYVQQWHHVDVQLAGGRRVRGPPQHACLTQLSLAGNDIGNVGVQLLCQHMLLPTCKLKVR